jgi:hypothetical protein
MKLMRNGALVIGAALAGATLLGTGHANATTDPRPKFVPDAHSNGFFHRLRRWRWRCPPAGEPTTRCTPPTWGMRAPTSAPPKN